MILISVVTITFNAARTLQRTLDSVARQRYSRVEHLIIDGASTDDTLAIARRYQAAAAYDVVVQSEPDHGLYDAMNKGLQKATGDYIVFLNAGDTLHADDTLQRVAEAADGLRPAVVYGDTTITDTEGRFLRLRTHRPPRVLTWRSFKQGMLVCHQAFYVRSDIARRITYNLQYRHSADVDWCIRVMKEAERQGLPLVNTNAVIADFEEGGDTTQHHRDSLQERYRVMAAHYGQVQTFLLHCWFVLRAILRKIA
ncbi:MAG: glycosyltransferase [Prevotella sp.]|nr:glycosyltransferase [Prevotella sp.]